MSHAPISHRLIPDTFGFTHLERSANRLCQGQCFDQNPERQLDRIELDKVFTDKASGKDTLRPELDALQSFVREGDTVVVHSMDRLARNLDDLRHLVQRLTKRGICITFIKENLTFTGEDSPMANLMLSVTALSSIMKHSSSS